MQLRSSPNVFDHQEWELVELSLKSVRLEAWSPKNS